VPRGKQTYVKKLHEARLHQAKLNAAAKPVTNYNGAGEAEVVPGFQLAKVLQDWTIRYLDGRSKNGSNRIGNVSFGDDEDDEAQYMFGPVQYLAHYSGIHIRRVSGICNGEFPMVPLSQADKILQAIERPDLLGDVVQVVPNPNWSPERWYTYMKDRTHCDE